MNYSSPEFRVKCTELLREFYKDVNGKTTKTMGTMEDIIGLSRRVGLTEKDVGMGILWLQKKGYLEEHGTDYSKLTRLGVHAVNNNLDL